jgi:hypothetical protein
MESNREEDFNSKQFELDVLTVSYMFKMSYGNFFGLIFAEEAEKEARKELHEMHEADKEWLKEQLQNRSRNEEVRVDV